MCWVLRYALCVAACWLDAAVSGARQHHSSVYCVLVRWQMLASQASIMWWRW